MKTETGKINGRKLEPKWKPFLEELAIYALKGFVTGVSVKLGGLAFDKTFKGNGTSLSLVKGGRTVANG